MRHAGLASNSNAKQARTAPAGPEPDLLARQDDREINFSAAFAFKQAKV